MNVKPIRTEALLIVDVCCDHIDAANSEAFKTEILALLDGPGDTVIDLTALKFMDSSGIGVMLACMRRIRAGGSRLVLCGLQPTVQAIVELVHLSRVIDIYATRTEAIEAIARGD